MLDASTILAAQFGPASPRKKAPPLTHVVTPDASGSKRKCDFPLPALSLPPPARAAKRLPVGWSLGSPAPRCAECGDDVDAATPRCLGKTGCPAIVCDACHAQSRRGQLRALAPRLRDAFATPRGRTRLDGLVQDCWPGGRVCEPCLARLERHLDETLEAPL